MNRWTMTPDQHSAEEAKLSAVSGFNVTSMTTCIIFSRSGREAFVIHFKDSVLMEGFDDGI